VVIGYAVGSTVLAEGGLVGGPEEEDGNEGSGSEVQDKEGLGSYDGLGLLVGTGGVSESFG
jgi:hypothetical protein